MSGPRFSRGLTGRRTFGDLLAAEPVTLHGSCTCSFCKRGPYDHGDSETYAGARKYSTRHYICDPCIRARFEVVMPAVKRRERLDARLAAILAREVQS